MKKVYLFIIFSALFALLCGCGRFDITCAIKNDNTAEMKVDIRVQKEGLSEDETSSLELSLNELMYYWEGEGFEVYWNYAGASFDLSAKKTAESESRADALDKLLDMMGDDVSPFIFVEGGYSESYFSDIYNIKAVVDLSKIVDYEYINTLPPSQKDKILNGINKFSGTVTFDLPGEIKSNTGNIEDGKNTVSLSLDQTAEIYSLMEVQNEENKQSYDALVEEIGQLEKEKQKYTLIIIAAGGALAVILAVSAVLLIRHKKRKLQ